MLITEEQKNRYIELVIRELKKKNLNEEEIQRILAKSNFYKVMELYPEEQLHDAPAKAAEEIILSAAIAI